MTRLIDDDGKPVVPLEYDATVTFTGMDVVYLWDALQVAAASSEIYSDTADFVGATLERFELLVTRQEG